jgi:hypothetical protein
MLSLYNKSHQPKHLLHLLVLVLVVASSYVIEQMLHSSPNLLAIALVSTLAIGLLSLTIVLEIERKLRTTTSSFQYHCIDSTDSRDNLLKECTKIISQAKEEIVALNDWASDWAEEETTRRSTTRRKYFAQLMKASERVAYKRIIQKDKEKQIAELYDKEHISHFREMIKARDCRSNKEPSIELEMAIPRYPSTFMIVDNKYLIWQVNEIDTPIEHTKKKFRMYGLIVIHDTSGVFISHFRSMIDKPGDRASVKMHHLADKDVTGQRKVA